MKGVIEYMDEIKLNINGKKVTGERGDTILEVCNKNGIDVPTLCHHDHLSDIGACRMCIVEIEGIDGYKTACTTPADDGMVIRTDTKEIKALRRALLELFFAERNHYCLFCETSGDCELQALAYQHGIDHIRYKYAFPKISVDSTSTYFVFDENRCILCRRCIRACSELAGHNVLNVRERGSRTRIIADLNEAFGDSSCLNCGTCLQVCPTGALIDRRSAYLGEMKQCKTTKTICAACSVGCGIEVVSRYNHILKINGDWDTEVNKGVLCVAGRFEPLYDRRERLTRPMIKRNGKFRNGTWDEALDYAAEKYKEIGMGNVAGMISPRATNEEARLFSELLGVDRVHELGPSIAKIGDGSLADIPESDCILIYKIDLDKEFRVVGSFVKLVVEHQKAKLILVDDDENSFDRYATLKLSSNKINQAKEFLNQANDVVVIYSTNSSKQEIDKISELIDNAKLIGLVAGANSRGLLDIGINGSNDIQNAKALYVLACDDELDEKFNRNSADFVVLQTSYLTSKAEEADVLLPSPIWVEKEGNFTNVDGKVQRIKKVVEAPKGVQSDETTIKSLMKKIKFKSDAE